MQRIGFERLARGLGRDAVEQAGAQIVDHDRHDDHREGPERRLDRVAAAAEQPLQRLPRSPRRRAGTGARFRPAP